MLAGQDFDVDSLIKPEQMVVAALTTDEGQYLVYPASPATGMIYVINNFISGHVRMRGRDGGRYPYHYLDMIDNLFGYEGDTIEVCSGSLSLASITTVDINKDANPLYVDDGQYLTKIGSNQFNRWRCDPPYNERTAKEMYGTDLPNTSKLLQAGARVCQVGSLMFLLLGPQNYQICPKGVKRIGLIFISVVPNNEIRCLNIYYKYQALPTLD